MKGSFLLMKKFFATAMLLATMVFTGCGGGQPADNAKAPAGDAPKKIVVGLDDEFPPMGFRDDKTNEIVGLDVDLAKAAAEKLGSEVEFKAIDWSSKEAELKSGRVDVLWNGLDITEKRKENMLFSDPYMDNKQIIFVRKGEANGIASENDLAGKIIGTQQASTAEEYFNSNENLKNSFKELKTYGDYTSAFMDLENGRVDAIVGDEIVGRYAMSKQPEKYDAIDIAVGPVSQFGIAFAKENTQLRDKVQKAFDEIIADGTAKKISEEWLGKDLIKAKN